MLKKKLGKKALAFASAAVMAKVLSKTERACLGTFVKMQLLS